MDFLTFFFCLLCLISFDLIFGFVVYIFYKYFDLKYFSQLEIEQLKEENKYLKEENKKNNGSVNFWGEW